MAAAPQSTFADYQWKILRISYKDHITNEEVRAKIQQAIGPHEGLLTVLKRRKLQWNGHVFRSSGMAKTISQGTVKGGRRQGGQRKRWENNIREWRGLKFAKSQRAVENRGSEETGYRISVVSMVLISSDLLMPMKLVTST